MTSGFTDAELLAALPAMRSYAHKLCRRHAEAAADLVQDAIVRALAGRHSYRPAGRLVSWLLTIVHHVHVTGGRRAARRAASSLSEEQAELLAAPDNPEIALYTREIAAAVARLPRPQREALVAGVLDGPSAAAERCGTNIRTIGSRTFRARERLRLLV